MSDLISRKALLKRLQEWNTNDPTDKALFNFAMNRIIEQPTIESRPNDDCVVITFEFANEAVKKQIPKKPYFEGDGYWNGELVYDTWICPCCEKHYEVDYDDYDYCPNCGQALDWSEEE